MGANGAGKSTLVKIMSGTLAARRGAQSKWRASRSSIPSPQAARALGIATVHQQTSQAGAPGLTVAENLILDEFCSGASSGFLSPRSIRRRAAEIAAALDLDLPLDRDFAELRPGRAPTDRHCAGGRGEVVGADPRRADLDAVGKRSRAAVRHPRTAARMPASASSISRTGWATLPASPTAPSCCAAAAWSANFRGRSISRRRSAP